MKPIIEFEMIQGPGVTSEAKFQSDKFFRIDKYYKIQGIDEVNPLVELQSYFIKNKTNEFYLGDYARYIRKSPEYTKALLLDLSNMGFLIYKLDDDKIIIKNRLFYYINAKMGVLTMMCIEFNSIISKNNTLDTTNRKQQAENVNSNATLNLSNLDLTIRGVDFVQLSDSQKVYIFPEGERACCEKKQGLLF